MFYESSHSVPQALSQPGDVAQLISSTCKSKLYKYKDGDSLARLVMSLPAVQGLIPLRDRKSVIKIRGERNTLNGLSQSKRRQYVNELCA